MGTRGKVDISIVEINYSKVYDFERDIYILAGVVEYEKLFHLMQVFTDII